LLKNIQFFGRYNIFSKFHTKFNTIQMNFKQNKDDLNRELEQFISTLNELLPRYSYLLRKSAISSEEITELGDIEHFLIEVNSKITEIKNMLEQDLFGHSLDVYYKLKHKALYGDFVAQKKFTRMREAFEEALKDGTMIVMN